MSIENPNESRELKEYSYEEGVRISLDRIKKLFYGSGRDVIVVVNGSGTNVGKSSLVRSLSSPLMEEGLRVEWFDYGNKEAYEKTRKQNVMIGINKSVFFMETQGLAYTSAEDYRDLWKEEGGHLIADIYIGIYRPDKPFIFSETEKKAGFIPLADILIRNEKAHEDNRKL